MNTASSKPVLSSEVIQAIESGNKIEAIKLLRESTGLGLKESKDLIDAYEDNRPVGSQPLRRGDSSNGMLMILIVVAIVGYAIYKLWFSQ